VSTPFTNPTTVSGVRPLTSIFVINLLLSQSSRTFLLQYSRQQHFIPVVPPQRVLSMQ
jgi:hypothetical protein